MTPNPPIPPALTDAIKTAPDVLADRLMEQANRQFVRDIQNRALDAKLANNWRELVSCRNEEHP